MNFRILIILIITSLFSCNQIETSEIIIGNNTLKVEIASTTEARNKGLMHRTTLEENLGMLFIFETERQVSFWMKNTSIPLSIAYINKNGKILEIYDLEPYSLESVKSKRSSILYALEVNQGYFHKNNIKIGDFINLP